MRLTALTLLAWLLAAAPAVGGSVTLDPSFSGDGRASIGVEGTDNGVTANDVAIAPDGKIVAAGSFTTPNGGGRAVAVARFLADGTPDASFGGGDGLAVHQPSESTYPSSEAFGVVVQPDGRIVVAGEIRHGADPHITEDMLVMRLDDAGGLDGTFSGDGIALADLQPYEHASDVALGLNGTLVVAGASHEAQWTVAVARFTSSGTLDGSFSGDGMDLVDFETTENELAHSVAVEADGGIVTAGMAFGGAPAQLVLTRHTAEGSLDPSLDFDGKQLTAIGEKYTDTGSLAIQPDGHLVVTGFSDGTGYVARFSHSGIPDSTFGTVGISWLAGREPIFNDIQIAADGAVIGAGSETVSPPATFGAIAGRLAADGSPDRAFGAGGDVLSVPLGRYSTAAGLALQEDGRIVGAGNSVSDDPEDLEHRLTVFRLVEVGDGDGDGVPDAQDACPGVPGQASHGGCPVQAGTGDADPIDGGPIVNECSRSKGTDIDGCLLEPGDILVSRSHDPSKVETLLGDTYFSHAALVLGYFDLDKRDAGRELIIADSDPGSHVTLQVLEESVFFDASASRLAEAYRYTAVPKLDRQRAAERMLGYLLRDGHADLPAHQGTRMWKTMFEYGIRPWDKGPFYFYCSAIAWWAYNEIGIEIDGPDRWRALVDNLYVTPEDLVTDEKLGPRPVSGVPARGFSVGIYPSGGASAAAAKPIAANLMVVDAKGRRTGKTARGKVLQEIPGAAYRSTPHSESVTADAVGSDWKVLAGGRRSGSYTLTTRSVGDATPAVSAVGGRARKGVTQTVRVGALAPGRTCRVPDVRRKTLTRARRMLRKARCGLVRVRGSSRARVRSQSPKPRTVLPGGAKVKLKLRK